VYYGNGITCYDKYKMAKKGRKPKGEFSGKLATFSTRIQPDTRKALEREAQATGQSISQVAERLIAAGLARGKKSEKDKAVRGLCFLIGQIAHRVSGIEQQDFPASGWRSSPFFYQAFKLTVAKVLDALAPKGEIKPPKLTPVDIPENDTENFAEFARTFETPEARADHTAKLILGMLETIPQWSQEEREAQRQYLSSMGVSASLWADFYGMPEAAKDLEIQPQSEQTISRLVNARHFRWRKG
jgi:hypothetical protein